MKKCTIINCENAQKYTGKGLCKKHYQRAWQYGRLELIRIVGNDEKRFWSKVNKTNGCWIWTGVKNHDLAYGRFTIDGKNVYAHRYSYELAKGKIPSKKVIDHLCRNESCVNPDHLEAVSNRENGIRGNTILNKKSGLPVGVSYDRGKYRAQIVINGVYRSLGRHETVEGARSAYDSARVGA